MLKLARILILITVAVSCSNPSPEEPEPVSVEEIRTQLKPTTVKTGFAIQKTFDYFIKSNGKIKALREQAILAEEGGIVAFTKIADGILVKSGEVIVRFPTAALELKLERAEQQLYNAEKEYESQLLGYESLLKEKTPDQATAICKKISIASGLSSARLDIAEIKLNLTKTSQSAPFSGRLFDSKVHEGMMVGNGEQLCKIFSPNDLQLETKILESDIGLIKLGQIAEVLTLAQPDKPYRAVVKEIYPVIDEHGMGIVRLTMLDIRDLLPGMNASLTIRIPQLKGVVVPKEAVVLRSGKPVVFTLENGLAKWNYITPGKDNGLEIEIKEGIRPGATVILTNNLQLSHDAPVIAEKY